MTMNQVEYNIGDYQIYNNREEMRGRNRVRLVIGNHVAHGDIVGNEGRKEIERTNEKEIGRTESVIPQKLPIVLGGIRGEEVEKVQGERKDLHNEEAKKTVTVVYEGVREKDKKSDEGKQIACFSEILWCVDELVVLRC